MIDHLVECDGQGGHIACHDIRCAVAYEYAVDTGFVDDAGSGVIIRGEHGDFLALLFHFE